MPPGAPTGDPRHHEPPRGSAVRAESGGGGLAVFAGVVALLLGAALLALFVILEFGLLSSDLRVTLGPLGRAVGFERLPGVGYVAPAVMVLGALALLARRGWGRWLGFLAAAAVLAAAVVEYQRSPVTDPEVIWLPGVVALATLLLLFGRPKRR